nr:hypothetical protein [Streptomyces californicus]
MQELARLGLGERGERHVRDQAAPVAPVHRVQASLPGQGQDEVGGQVPVPSGGDHVRDPPVELGCGALVGVQEQGDPGNRVRDPVDLGDEHRGEGPQRFGQQPGLLLLLPGPPAEHRPQPTRAPGQDRRVDTARERSDDRYRAGRDQPGLRGGERSGRGRAGLRLVVGREPPGRLVDGAPVDGEEPVERLERVSLLGELLGESGEYVRHGVGALVDRRGDGPELGCRVTPFAYE